MVLYEKQSKKPKTTTGNNAVKAYDSATNQVGYVDASARSPYYECKDPVMRWGIATGTIKGAV